MIKVFTFLALWISTSLVAQKTDWNQAEDIEEYQSVLEKAHAADKMLFVSLTGEKDSAWQRMNEEEIFSDSSVVKALQNYTLIHIPINSEMGSRWVQLFPAKDIPAFYFLDRNEFLFVTTEGFQSTDDLVKSASETETTKTEYSNLKEKYSEGKLTTSEWKKLLAVHSLNFPFEQTMSIAMEFLNHFTGNELLQKDVLPVLTTYGIDLQTPYPGKVIQNRETISSEMESFSFEDYFANVYSYNFDLAVNSEDSIFIEKLITEIVPHNPDSLSTSRELALETRRLYAEETGQLHIWGKGILAYAEEIENKEEKAEAIFDVAYIIADQYNSETALHTARKLANKAASIHEDFRYVMLESYMSYLQKDYGEAERLVRKAATLTENPNNVRKAEGLLKMIVNEKEQETTTEETPDNE